MNIDGVNFVNGLNSTNSYNKKKNTSFKGHVLTENNEGKPVYKFFLPNAPKDSKLHVTVLARDKEGFFKPIQNEETFDLPSDYKSVTLNADDYITDNNVALGYRFTVNGKDYTDKGVKDKTNKYTLTVPVHNANPHRSRLMQHVLVDSFNVQNPSSDKRNHFNLLGGTLKSVQAKVPELAENGIREIIGNPVFGQDNKSSHGYWTTNPLQITNNIGSYKDFKDLMINLYNYGMGWTADGAFVNEGHEGIHMNDIVNWGAQSPFINLFETKDLENTQIRFGVLSKNDDVNKHIHIKLVNAPYKIVFEKTEDGYREKEVVKSSVDASKSTYIQLFDDRLVSDEQVNDNNIFDAYAVKEAQDPYEISSSRDSVQPLHFRVKPSEVLANFDKYKENKKFDKETEFKNYLTQWTNFSIVNSNKDGGASLWVGNNDISKKRFILSEYALNSMNLPADKQKEVVAAQYQVQDETVQVGKFWTNEVSRMLTEYTARILAAKVAEYMTEAESNGTELSKADAYEKAVKSMVDENIIHKDALAVTEHEKIDNENVEPSALENLLSIDDFDDSRMYTLKPTVMPENITDGLMSYPLDAIEFSPELTTVFAYPFIKNLAVDKVSVGLSRYEMFKQGDDYYNKMPARYREIYKSADKLYTGTLTQKAEQIMKSVDNIVSAQLFDGKKLTEEGREIYSLIAPDVAKFLVVSALAPELDFDKNSDVLQYDLKKLQEYDINKLNLQYETSPEDMAKSLLAKIDKGVNSISNEKIEDFAKYLAARVKGVDSDAFNVAKLIIDKTETGLDWRIDAAKDVGDWDAVEAKRYSSKVNENRIMDFWNKFNTNVLKYNPNSYKIGEVTDWGINKSDFLDKSGFDTMTDYEAFFSDLVSLYAQNDEGKFVDNFSDVFKKCLDKYFENGTPDNLNFTHRFVGNHDKPRILHLLATNVSAFNMDKAQEVQRVLERGFESSDVFKSLKHEYKSAIKQGLADLRNGYHHVNGERKEFDSENFAIRPFDYSIADAIEEARVNNKDFNDFVNKNPQKIEKLKAEALVAVLKPAMAKYRSILFAMVGLPGTPTHYSGDEFGQTGWETFCKNEKQENRNAIRWDWLNDKNYEFIKKQYEDVFKPLMRVRNMEAASALVNGATQPIDTQGFTDNSHGRGGVVGLYRYNDKTDAIVLLHGAGYGKEPYETGLNKGINQINLEGIGYPLKPGTIYVDALNPKSKYKVVKVNDDKSVIKALDEKGNTTDYINLGNAGLILLRESDFNGNKFNFETKKENPHVKLANTKYDFRYMQN